MFAQQNSAMPSPRARVFFVNRYFYPDESATAQLLADLAFGLAATGVEVHVVCSRQLYTDEAAALPTRETIGAVHVHRLWTTRFGRDRLLGRAIDYASFYLTAAGFLLMRLRRRDVVVAKTDPPLISVFAALAARLRRAVLVNWLQDVFPEVASALGANPLPAALDRLLRWLRNASLRQAAVNIVLGERMRDTIAAQGVPAAQIEVIENWADTDALSVLSPAHSALRASLGLQDRFVVGYSGNLGRAHEYQTLLGAAVRLRNDSSVAFLVSGGGIRMDALHLAARERGLHNIRFLPYQPRATLRDSLAAADVHVVSLLPGLEGLIVPSKFYGILAAGRPVFFIGDSDGEVARVLRAHHCGVVIAPGASGDLVNAIHRLQSASKERESMAEIARRLAVGRYSAAAALGRWSSLLARVAEPALVEARS
jgi:glycosyltransferase involved in cell wall biosynthesis